jgi:TonB family protein
MLATRLPRCPLRQPRIWLWALAVALPGHIALAYSLGWQRTGNVVACPIATPLRVTLHQAKPQLSVPLALQSSAISYQALRPRPVEAPTATVSTRIPNQAATAAAPSAPVSESPAAAPTPGIMTASSLGFLVPPAAPAYPAASRARGEEGTALLLALVSAAGTPDELKLEHSSGYSRLDTAALSAAAGWQFNQPPIPTWVRVPVRFALTN